jgi:hypothetical protein
MNDYKRFQAALRHLSFDESGAACHTCRSMDYKATAGYEKHGVYALPLRTA